MIDISIIEKKYLYYLILLVFIFSCKQNKNVPKNDIVYSISSSASNDETLKSKLSRLGSDCLNFENLWSEFEKNSEFENFVDKNKESWLFGLEIIDSLQFEHADLIKPRCKLFENGQIVTIVFSDFYDYKTALHLFTFKKPELIPISSFILYSIGGDAEDFWDVSCDKINDLTYKLTETEGYYKNELDGDVFIKFRLEKKVEIDSITGLLKKDLLKTEKNIDGLTRNLNGPKH